MRIRLILSFTLIVIVTIASVIFIAVRQTASEVRAFMFRGGLSGTESIVSALENYYANNNTWLGADDVLKVPRQTQRRRPGNSEDRPGMMENMSNMIPLRLLLANADGELLIDTSSTNPKGQFNPSELHQAIPLYDNGKVVGYLMPEGGLPFTAANEIDLLGRLNRVAVTAGLVAGGVALILALIVAHNLLRPVQALTRAASNLAEGDLTQRVKVHGDDELAILGKTFNHMASSLEHAKESRRALTADIAHELRTPLAVQRAHIDAIQDGIYPLTPENLSPIDDQNLLLTRLVEDLNTLTLADTGRLELELFSTDFPTLIEQVVNRFTPQTASPNIEIQLELDETCPSILLDPGRMEQIISNLLTNALRFTPDGGCISINLSSTPEQANLSIHDNGPGIPEEALPHIFERFYRADKSRSRSKGGTGLGLSIARKIAHAHGGELMVANHPQGGAVFTLILPIKNGGM